MFNKKIFGIVAIFCLIGLVMIILPGCSKKIVNENSNNNVIISMSTKASGIEMSELAEVFVLTIDAEDFPIPIAIPLTLEGSFLVGQMIVPVGENRIFTINAYELPIFDVGLFGALIYQGTDTADVIFNSTVTVNIDMFPVVPLLKVVPRTKSERISSLPMGDPFTVDVYAYNVPEVNYISFDLSYLTNNPILNFLHISLGADLPADSRVSYEGGNSSVTIWLDRPNLAGPLVDELGNAHILTFNFDSHSDTMDDFDTTIIAITPIILDRGNGEVSDPFPLDSLYLEPAMFELFKVSDS